MFIKSGMILLFIATFSFLAGCATIVSKSKSKVSINSTPAGAKISVKNNKGNEVYSGVTPAVVTLKTGAGYFSSGEYEVTFEMSGYDKRTRIITSSLNGWYIGNIVFGGLLGMLIVDPLTGAMWTLDSEMLSETLTKTTSYNDIPSVNIIYYSQIPESWKSNLIRVNQ